MPTRAASREPARAPSVLDCHWNAGADVVRQPADRRAGETHAAVRDSTAEYASDVRESVQGDLAWAAAELAQDIGAGAQRECEWSACFGWPHLDCFFDEEFATRCRRCCLSHHRAQASNAVFALVQGHAAVQGVDDANTPLSVGAVRRGVDESDAERLRSKAGGFPARAIKREAVISVR